MWSPNCLLSAERRRGRYAAAPLHSRRPVELRAGMPRASCHWCMAFRFRIDLDGICVNLLGPSSPAKPSTLIMSSVRRPPAVQFSASGNACMLQSCCMEPPTGFGNRWKSTRTNCNTKSAGISPTNFVLFVADQCFGNGGHGRNRTGVHGFAVRCVTTPPRGQSGKRASGAQALYRTQSMTTISTRTLRFGHHCRRRNRLPRH